MKTILVVDDTKTNIRILIELLGESYDVLTALDGMSALEIVKEEKVDLILLDIVMPEMDGYEVCRKLKSNEETKDISVIFITAQTDEDSIEKAYDVGGIDYVTKPFKHKELLARVRRELQLNELISNLEETQEELKLLASTDSMTKLYNRRYFGKISEHILDLARRDATNLSIIMLDIDKFKNVNDTYGHSIGDDVIIVLADYLQELTRKSDIVCRYGGEEFVILLPETTIEGANIIAEKIRSNIEKIEVPLSDENKLKFTISLGVSIIDIDNENNIEDGLKRADEALYEAKESGRNKVCKKLI